jgi:hypothetical protein
VAGDIDHFADEDTHQNSKNFQAALKFRERRVKRRATLPFDS